MELAEDQLAEDQLDQDLLGQVLQNEDDLNQEPQTSDPEMKDGLDHYQEMENYFKNTHISHLFFDKDLILRKYSPRAIKQFNLTSDQIGRSISEIKDYLRYPSIIKNLNWVLSTSKTLEKEIQTKDLSWYQMTIIPNLNKTDNKPNGVVITFIDITRRVNDLKNQEKIIAEYETLLDTISHDIKNRLTGMFLSIQMLNECNYQDQDEVKLYVNTLEGGLNKIKLIVGEMFASKDQKHKYEATEEILNIENILEDIQVVLGNEIAKTNAKIKCDITASEIVFPRRQLRSILFNLVSNAIKFRSPDRDPEVLISTRQEDHYMLIAVKDNGIGIDPKKQDAIFSKFFRIEKSVEGSGIGLHLVKTLVKNSGGKVEIESQLGQGSEFKIYLKSKCSLTEKNSR